MKRKRCLAGLPGRRKRGSGTESILPTSAGVSCLSSDVLHTVLSFLVSENGCVDGEALGSASLVCKKWREVAGSRSLWSIPTGLQGRDGARRKDSIDISLSLWDLSSYGERTAGVHSLMGFRKVRNLEASRGSDAARFVATEKATGKGCILSISNSNEKSDDLIKEVFRAHQLEQENFLRPNARSCAEAVPRGVRILNDRVVRWYEHETVRSSVVTPPKKNTCHHHCENEDQPSHSTLMPHMLKFQESLGHRNPSRKHLRSDAWAMIVDWVAEVAECFNLDDETIFRAMDLVDRVVSTTQVRQRIHALPIALVFTAHF